MHLRTMFRNPPSRVWVSLAGAIAVAVLWLRMAYREPQWYGACQVWESPPQRVLRMVHGVVLDSNGVPQASMRVQLLRPVPPDRLEWQAGHTGGVAYDAVTDERGSFDLDVDSSRFIFGRDYTMRVTDDQQSVLYNGTVVLQDLVCVRLPGTQALSGAILLGDERRYALVGVHIEQLSDCPLPAWLVSRCDLLHGGRFHARAIPRHADRLAVVAHIEFRGSQLGSDAYRVAYACPRLDSGTHALEMHLAPAVVPLTVVDELGMPIPNVEIRVGSQTGSTTIIGTSRTASDGEAQLLTCGGAAEAILCKDGFHPLHIGLNASCRSVKLCRLPHRLPRFRLRDPMGLHLSGCKGYLVFKSAVLPAEACMIEWPQSDVGLIALSGGARAIVGHPLYGFQDISDQVTSAPAQEVSEYRMADVGRVALRLHWQDVGDNAALDRLEAAIIHVDTGRLKFCTVRSRIVFDQVPTGECAVFVRSSGWLFFGSARARVASGALTWIDVIMKPALLVDCSTLSDDGSHFVVSRALPPKLSEFWGRHRVVQSADGTGLNVNRYFIGDGDLPYRYETYTQVEPNHK